MDKVKLMNAEYANVNRKELLQSLFQDIESHKGSSLIFLNVDVVMKIEKDEYLQKIVRAAEYVIADGMPLVWISRWFNRPLKEKISGSDFVPILCKYAAKKNKTVFLAGGTQKALTGAIKNLKKAYPEICIVGSYSPPFGFENNIQETERMNNAIKQTKPDILIVCLGCPKQEKYIYENKGIFDAGISVCAGATIDFLSGNISRCPSWMSNYGLEWLYRFFQEPRRLFKRYFIDDIQVLYLIWKYRKQIRTNKRM